MPKCGRAWRVLASAVVFVAAPLVAQAAALAPAPARSPPDEDSVDEQRLIEWVKVTRDSHGLPFAVVDKKAARLTVFSARGRRLGSSPVLIGAASGDESTPGVGRMDPARIPLAARTTPAGRFGSVPGRNLQGEGVVWFDYDAGLAIHRLRPGRLAVERRRRLEARTPAASHASAGCVVVPVAFFERVVAPALGSARGVVYVTPELQPLERFFPGVADDSRDD